MESEHFSGIYGLNLSLCFPGDIGDAAEVIYYGKKWRVVYHAEVKDDFYELVQLTLFM